MELFYRSSYNVKKQALFLSFPKKLYTYYCNKLKIITMARPLKHNAEYFSHDCIMRNDPKIKALRRKYSHTGYSVWNMLLELLTSNEYFEYEWNELNIELLAPDFDIDAEDLNEIINYCIKLNLLQITNGYLHCERLTQRLEESVLVRRKDYCSNNSKRNKLKGVNVNNNLVNDNINGQSKGKESKLKESKANESKAHESIANESVALDNDFLESAFASIQNHLNK